MKYNFCCGTFHGEKNNKDGRPEMTAKKNTTIHDIAKYCGLSKSLVAYIINGSTYRKSTEANREKVAEAVRVLNYRPNRAARSLSSRKSGMIGVLIPVAGSTFYSEVSLAIQQTLTKRGYTALFAFWPSDAHVSKRIQAAKSMINCNVDGILSWYDCELYRQAGIPAVIFGSGRKKSMYDLVMPDFAGMAGTLLSYWRDLGHSGAGFIGQDKDPRCLELLRQAGDFGFTVRRKWILDPGNSPEAFVKHLRGNAEDLPGAWFIRNDELAFPLLAAAQDAGFRIPDDFSAVSCDNTPYAGFFRPGLDSFDLNIPQIAEVMTETLMERMREPERPPVRRAIPVRLVRRKSSGPALRTTHLPSEK